jgi:hypothetical protein
MEENPYQSPASEPEPEPSQQQLDAREIRNAFALAGIFWVSTEIIQQIVKSLS